MQTEQPTTLTTSEELTDWIAGIGDPEWITLDTEFMRERTYYAKLALLQIGTEHAVACIDPLTIENLEPLWQLIYNPGVTKVLHSARQDLEILFDLHDRLPTPIFDTQIAATILGYGDQIGYGRLVQEVLGVTLDKSLARTDWMQRPLSDAQLRYAADDVHYLGQIYLRFRQQLATERRLSWLADDFAALEATATYRNELEDAWRRVRGANGLGGTRWSALVHLAAWRELTAQQQDRPRKWILSDDHLVEIAKRRPDSKAALSKIRGLPEKTLSRYGDNLLKIIHDSAAISPPVDERETPLSEHQESLLDLLMATVRWRAVENRIAPALLAPRKELARLIRGERELAILKGWRREVAGEELLTLLTGHCTLRIADKELTIESL